MVSLGFSINRRGLLRYFQDRRWCPGDSPLREGGFLGYSADRRWCPGDPPLTDGDFPGYSEDRRWFLEDWPLTEGGFRGMLEMFPECRVWVSPLAEGDSQDILWSEDGV